MDQVSVISFILANTCNPGNHDLSSVKTAVAGSPVNNIRHNHKNGNGKPSLMKRDFSGSSRVQSANTVTIKNTITGVEYVIRFSDIAKLDAFISKHCIGKGNGIVLKDVKGSNAFR